MPSDNLKDLNYVDAVMIVDRHGKIVYSIRYNPRFNSGESLERYVNFEDILNKNFLEVYPKMLAQESTMMNCLEDGKPIYMEDQTFEDYKGRVITTNNLTLPIIRRGKILGAIELSKDITKLSDSTSFDKVKKTIKKNKFNFSDIITNNHFMLENIEKAKLICDTPTSVLIYGETGTGKELFVQSIHNYSYRKNKPFIVQNCAAIPDSLFESILFGTVKGAFTGAIDKEGIFEAADGGTLFLDEINSMPLNLQAKLLRVLQDGKIRRVGSNEEIEVDVRIISAMNVDPIKAIEKKEIRRDLFYRLSAISLKLLPLRERKEDILLYADYFISIYSKRIDRKVLGLSKKVQKIFLDYNWPGNVRELEHIIESSINFVDKNYIEIAHLPVYMKDYKMQKNTDFTGSLSLEEKVIELEKDIIKRTLTEFNGNKTKAAEKLKISRQSLHYKIEKYKIE